MKEHPHLCSASEVKCCLCAGSLLILKSFHNDRIHFNTCGLVFSLGPLQPWEHWGSFFHYRQIYLYPTRLSFKEKNLFQLPGRTFSLEYKDGKKEKKMSKTPEARSLEENKAEKILHFQLWLKCPKHIVHNLSTELSTHYRHNQHDLQTHSHTQAE